MNDRTKEPMQVGGKYEFTMLRNIVLQENPNEEYFIIRKENGSNYLLPCIFYSHFGFKNGQTILCYLDRINCVGRYFFEPEHPFYKYGREYLFKFNRWKQNKNGKPTIEVLDCFGKPANVVPFDWQNQDTYQPHTIKCQVERQKKGTLFLINNDDYHPLYKVGSRYHFVLADYREIKGIFHLTLSRENTIIQIGTEPETKMSYSLGDTILCELSKINYGKLFFCLVSR